MVRARCRPLPGKLRSRAAGKLGTSIGAVKARVLAGDWDGACADAEWALDVDSRHADSPIGRYAASLALLVLNQDDEALVQAASIQSRDDFPRDVADAMTALALRDADLYADARRLRSPARSRRARSTSRTFLSPTP